MDKMMFFTVLKSLASLCVLILFGLTARKLKIITDDVSRGLSSILLNFTLPCTIIMAMQRPFDRGLLVSGGVILGVSVAAHFAAVAVGIVLCRVCGVKDKQKGVWLFVMSFANIAYMGFPLISAIYGQEALFFCAMGNVAFNLLLPSLGTFLIRIGVKEEPKTKHGANTALAATFIGLLLFVFSVKIPETLSNALTMTANMTTPVSMLIVGSFLAQSSLKTVLGDKKLYVLSAARLLLMPVCLLFALKPFIADSVMLGVMVYLAAMPAAAVTVIFAEQYNSDTAAASRAVFVTMILSLVTIPVIALLM